MQIKRPTSDAFFPPIKIVSSVAPPSYKNFGKERQNVLGRLFPEEIYDKYAFLRFSDRGGQDSSEFEPTNDLSFRVLLDENPLLATLIGPNLFEFTWNGLKYECNKLTIHLRLQFYD